MNVGSPEGKREKHRDEAAQQRLATPAKQPHAQQNQRRCRALDRHRPHHDIDVVSDQQQVEDDIERIERCFTSDEEGELPVQHGQQRDDRDGSRKQPKQPVAEKPDRVRIDVERPRQHKTAEDKKGNDSAGAI
jgi:hypothetical protein